MRKANPLVPVHVAFQVHIAEPRKAYDRAIFMWMDAGAVRSHAQFLADIVGREVRVTFPDTPDQQEVDRRSGRYYSPKLRIV